MRRYFLLGIFWLASSLALQAQQTCEEKLAQAQEWLDQGHLNGISTLLNECLNDYTNQQKVQAYRILTMSYLYNDDPFSAENSFLALLEVDPEYQVTESDPVELEHLSAQFISDPIISWRFMAGANLSTIQVIHVNGTDNTNNSQQSYSPDFGFVANGSVDLHFSRKFSLTAGVELSSHRFNYSNRLFEDVASSGAGSFVDADVQTKAENHFAVGVPVSFKYTFEVTPNNWYGYVYAGYKISYNTLNRADLRLEPSGVGGTNPPPVTGPSLNIEIIRSDLQHAVLGGIGVMKRFGYKYGFIDVRYQAGLKNVLDRTNQFNFSESGALRDYTFNYGMVDDDFRQNSIYLNVGIILPMYKPRKANTVTIQSVLKSWFTKKEKGGEDE